MKIITFIIFIFLVGLYSFSVLGAIYYFVNKGKDPNITRMICAFCPGINLILSCIYLYSTNRDKSIKLMLIELFKF